MNSDIFISVVIPTFNRSKYLLKILQKLKKNFLNFKNFEIIICDSYSKDNTEIKINNFKKNNLFLPIQYLNIRKNIHSLKRNLGLRFAKGKYIIFLDDDCFPEDTFVKNYYALLIQNKEVIYCGTVKYPKQLLKKNFIKYRQSTHFIVNKGVDSSLDYLPAKKIVTMNMAFKKDIFIRNKVLFNNNFNRYGFEDYELGFRLTSINKFKIIKSSPVIYHNDERTFFKYLEKIKFLGFEGMKYLIKLNFLAAKNNNFYKLEIFFLSRFLLNFNIFKDILILIQKFCVFVDKKFLYFPFIYKIAIGSAYLEGCFYRKRYNDNRYINSFWYK
jgi:glycosyltransferase involved in cell wall biosynthesis